MFTFKELKEAYHQLDIEPNRTISLKTNLLGLGRYEKGNKKEILADHFRALDDCFSIQANGSTLVTATSSRNLCNTQVPFDMENTPSTVGALTEYIRKHPGSKRSFHAFDSYAAIGKKSDIFCENTSRMSYGFNTPEARMIEEDAICICLGVEARKSVTTVHHVELMSNVPYRYVKEYLHPVVNNGQIEDEAFYRHVWYRNCGIIRGGNIVLFKKLQELGMELRQIPLGSGFVQAYSMKEFFEKSLEIFQNNPYVWLKHPPERFPWRD